MMTLLYGWRFGSAVFPRRPRLYFWICLPLIVSLWLSTIYLRHHWVPIVPPGWRWGSLVLVHTDRSSQLARCDTCTTTRRCQCLTLVARWARDI